MRCSCSIRISSWSVLSHLSPIPPQCVHGCLWALTLQLMQEPNIRLVDRRHTLPNLKALLLTLSSHVPPPPPPHPSIIAAASAGQRSSSSGTSTQLSSRAASRQASYNWPASASTSGSTVYYPRKSGGVYSTPPSSVGGDMDYMYVSGMSSGGKDTPTPLAAMLAAASPTRSAVGAAELEGRRRSHLSRPSWGGSLQGDGGDEDGDTVGSTSEILSDI